MRSVPIGSQSPAPPRAAQGRYLPHVASISGLVLAIFNSVWELCFRWDQQNVSLRGPSTSALNIRGGANGREFSPPKAQKGGPGDRSGKWCRAEIRRACGQTGPARTQGFVLLVVLWVLTSAVLARYFLQRFRPQRRRSAVSEVGLTKSEALLDAGLEVAAAHLIDKDEKRRWRGDGKPHRKTLPAREMTIAITDADRPGRSEQE